MCYSLKDVEARVEVEGDGLVPLRLRSGVRGLWIDKVLNHGGTDIDYILPYDTNTSRVQLK